MGVSRSSCADIKPILKALKSDGDYTNERIEKIVANAGIANGIGIYKREGWWPIACVCIAVVGVSIWVGTIPYNSSKIHKIVMWLGFGVAFYAVCAYSKYASKKADQVRFVREEEKPSAYKAIERGLIPSRLLSMLEFPPSGGKHGCESPIAWCVRELESTTDAALYAAVYTHCGLKSMRDSDLSEACAYIKDKKQLEHLVNLGAKITDRNLEKILIKAIAAWNGDALQLIAGHYDRENKGSENFISKSVIKALIHLKKTNPDEAKNLANCLFSGCNPSYQSPGDLPIGVIDPNDLASLNVLVEQSSKYEGRELPV